MRPLFNIQIRWRKNGVQRYMYCYKRSNRFLIEIDEQNHVNQYRGKATTRNHINYLQGHHHNSDQAARGSHMMCSICGCLFVTPRLGARGVGDGPIRRLPNGFLLAPHCHIWSISYCLELFSRLQKRFCPPVQPGYDVKTTLEATASSAAIMCVLLC